MLVAPGFDVIARSDRDDARVGGGSLIIARNNLVTRPIHFPGGASNACGFEIEIGGHTYSFMLVYRPPSVTGHDDEILGGYIRDFVSSSKNPIVLGDFNLPSVNWATRVASDLSDKSLMCCLNELNLCSWLNSLLEGETSWI